MGGQSGEALNGPTPPRYGEKLNLQYGCTIEVEIDELCDRLTNGDGGHSDAHSVGHVLSFCVVSPPGALAG